MEDYLGQGKKPTLRVLRILTYTEDGLFQVSLYVPRSIRKLTHEGLEPPVGTRNKRKATVKIQRIPPLRILPLINLLDQKVLLQNVYFKLMLKLG